MEASAVIEHRPILEVFVGILGLVIIILVHGAGIRAISFNLSRVWAGFDTTTPRWRTDMVLARVIVSLTTLHLIETLLIAYPLSAFGILPSLRDSYFFVLESYTTLGGGDVNLPDSWRLFGPIIAIAGLFTFGWTGSVLVSMMSRIGQIDSDKAQIGRAKTPLPKPPEPGV